ncbi:Elongation factor-like GTPase 1 [Chamberlinius hualienensis]
MAQNLLDRLPILQRETQNIRNICIMAHVDHGKTTLADSLVASNGIISHRMAGKLRYMDSRKDEQERGITMKSSSIALQYQQNGTDYLINLIDSPGHVDFSGEVSSAIQVCDGALIVVDVVEGVCAQTVVAVRHAWSNGIRMILVLNKVDRLITELKLTALDAFIRLQRILEQVNAIMGELFNAEVLGKTSENGNSESNKEDESDGSANQLYDWSSGVDDTDDSNLYFTPDQGNVIFASGLDGWGFRVQHFADMYSQKLGVKKEILYKTLWGDYYLNTKTKRIMKGAQNKAKKCLFVQFVLDNLWAAYESIILNRDKERVAKIWLPLASVILEAVCEILPSPLEICEDRAQKLICCKGQRFDALPEETQRLKQALITCGSSRDDPVIVFVSKMFAVEKSSLPERRRRPLTSEDIARRRDMARQKHFNKTETAVENHIDEVTSEYSSSNTELVDYDHVFVAFARVFSGVVRKGQQLYVLGPKHNPCEALARLSQGEVVDSTLTVESLKSNEHVTVTVVKDLYALMGRELEILEEVPAGNIIGIGQLESHVIKHASLSSTVACPSLGVQSIHTIPIMRVAVEPAHSSDMPALVRGLKLLNQADASVRVLIQETGEHVIVTAGEVHLQRCLDDLRESFAKVPINVSPPIVPFRETVVLPPKVDMVNEKIVASDKSQTRVAEESKRIVEGKTLNKQATIKIRVCPLPQDVVTLIDDHQELIKTFETYAPVLRNRKSDQESCNILDEDTVAEMKKFKIALEKLFKDAGMEWGNAVEQLWGFGPHRCGPNILLCNVSESIYNRPSYWAILESDCALNTHLPEFDSCFVSGFQLATVSGPMCEEPMRGTCFIVEEITFESRENISENCAILSDSCDDDKDRKVIPADNVSSLHGPLSGQIMSLVRELCRKAFQAQPQRLMAAMYSCNIQVTAEVLDLLTSHRLDIKGRENDEEGGDEVKCNPFGVIVIACSSRRFEQNHALGSRECLVDYLWREKER